MTYGNYDAGQFRPVSDPVFNGGLRKVDAGKTEFNFGFNTVDNKNSAWGVERTTVNPEARIESTTNKGATALASVAADVDNDRFVDEMLNPFITDESRKHMASTSFTGAMAWGPMDNFLS